MSNSVTIPILQVRPGMLVLYNQVEWPGGRPRSSDIPTHSPLVSPDKSKTDNFNGKSAYAGVITPHARKRLRRAINLLTAIAQAKWVVNPSNNKLFPFRLNFVTLTLPAPQRGVSDKLLKKQCLDPWIKSMRRRHGLKSYVWRAERQFNGNLHFHITTDTYLPYDDLCHQWNRFLDRFHFIREFQEKHGKPRPNSTDVHSVNKIRNLASYMVKYMSKTPEDHLADLNEKRLRAGQNPIVPEDHEYRSIDGQPEWNQPIEGKVWDCSVNLKCSARCEMVVSTQEDKILRACLARYPQNVKSNDFFTLIFLSQSEFLTAVTGTVLMRWLEYLYYIRNYTGPPVAEPIPDSVADSVPGAITTKYGTQLALDLKKRYRI